MLSAQILNAPEWKMRLLEKKRLERIKKEMIPSWKKDLLKRLHEQREAALPRFSIPHHDDFQSVLNEHILKVSENVFMRMESVRKNTTVSHLPYVQTKNSLDFDDKLLHRQNEILPEELPLSGSVSKRMKKFVEHDHSCRRQPSTIDESPSNAHANELFISSANTEKNECGIIDGVSVKHAENDDFQSLSRSSTPPIPSPRTRFLSSRLASLDVIAPKGFSCKTSAAFVPQPFHKVNSPLKLKKFSSSSIEKKNSPKTNSSKNLEFVANKAEKSDKPTSTKQASHPVPKKRHVMLQISTSTKEYNAEGGGLHSPLQSSAAHNNNILMDSGAPRPALPPRPNPAFLNEKKPIIHSQSVKSKPSQQSSSDNISSIHDKLQKNARTNPPLTRQKSSKDDGSLCKTFKSSVSDESNETKHVTKPMAKKQASFTISNNPIFQYLDSSRDVEIKKAESASMEKKPIHINSSYPSKQLLERELIPSPDLIDYSEIKSSNPQIASDSRNKSFDSKKESYSLSQIASTITDPKSESISVSNVLLEADESVDHTSNNSDTFNFSSPQEKKFESSNSWQSTPFPIKTNYPKMRQNSNDFVSKTEEKESFDSEQKSLSLNSSRILQVKANSTSISSEQSIHDSQKSACSVTNKSNSIVNLCNLQAKNSIQNNNVPSTEELNGVAPQLYFNNAISAANQDEPKVGVHDNDATIFPAIQSSNNIEKKIDQDRIVDIEIEMTSCESNAIQSKCKNIVPISSESKYEVQTRHNEIKTGFTNPVKTVSETTAYNKVNAGKNSSLTSTKTLHSAPGVSTASNRYGGKSFVIDPKKFKKSLNSQNTSSNTLNGATGENKSSVNKQPTDVEPPQGKRKPRVDQITVIGGYVKLDRSTLAKPNKVKKDVQVKFLEEHLASVHEYPSERSLLEFAALDKNNLPATTLSTKSNSEYEKYTPKYLLAMKEEEILQIDDCKSAV